MWFNVYYCRVQTLERTVESILYILHSQILLCTWALHFFAHTAFSFCFLRAILSENHSCHNAFVDESKCAECSKCASHERCNAAINTVSYYVYRCVLRIERRAKSEKKYEFRRIQCNPCHNSLYLLSKHLTHAQFRLNENCPFKIKWKRTNGRVDGK